MKKILFLAMLTCNIAHAQNFSVSIAASSNFQISRDEGGQKSCGIRSMIVYNDPLQKHSARAIDFSLVIYSTLMTVIKFGVLNVNASTGGILPIGRQEKVYLASPAQDINLTSEHPMESESENYTLALFKDSPSAIKVLDAISIGETMQIQIPRKNEPLYTTVQFSAPMSVPEQQALIECLSNLGSRVKKENDAK
ncbi:MAG: hypothetical protein WA071_09570 [Undibacterium umbellatum]|uniref:hypothetical protein n=1 Tax=Undibacterium umbellatum TaxID=2762300 RepID=UPI003BB7A41A